MNVPYLMRQDVVDLGFDLSKDQMAAITETDRFPIFQQMAADDDRVCVCIRISSEMVKAEVPGADLMGLPEMEMPMGAQAATQWGEE